MTRKSPAARAWRPSFEMLTAAIAAVALVATTVAIAGPDREIELAAPADIGTLRPSMVEMLDESDVGTPLRLGEVRKAVEGYLDGGEWESDDDEVVDGSGVDVALVDTGVAPVPGLDGKQKVLHGPDLSFEGASAEAAFLDTYGHGTHMAGIIAGTRRGDEGVAPGARIISLKTAGHDGITTVPQVVAAIDWVVEHRNTDGLNIRVLNLSLGQEGVQNHYGDALSAAVERAWQAGIFVVVAAGNSGERQKHLDSPAIDPYVLAVGAQDYLAGGVAPFSANGNGHRNPDVVAPGRSIASYRVPGSTVDQAAPHARVGDDLFLGSGTSQAAAVTSGAAALILQARPSLTPDQVKATLSRNAVDLSAEPAHRDGNGVLSANKAEKELDIEKSEQYFRPAAGKEFGFLAPTGATWTGGGWSGATWTGATWTGATWTGATWTGATWTGATWTGATWTGATWTGATWTGKGWS